MTPTDYQLLSESIKGCLPNLEGDDRYDVLTVVNAITNGLSANNKAFDSYRFISDCGLAGWCTNCGQEETPNCNNANCS